MPINLNALQQQRRDTASNWTSNNPTLLAGEWGIETDTKKFKIGDGTTAWQSLVYLPIPDANRLLTGSLTVGGNFTVNGNTTIIDSQTLQVEDANIVLGKVSTPTDTTADGGGITLKGATDKTFNWLDATDSWTSSENIAIPDNKKFTAGDNQDLQLFHNATDSYIDNETGILRIRNTGSNGSQIQLLSNSGGIKIQGITGEQSIVCQSNGSVQLFANNVKKAETSATGFDIPEDFIGGSGSKLTVGASGDLTLFHDSTNSYVQNNTGDLILGDTNHQYFRGNTSDKSVSLYFLGSEKAKTINTGFSVTGTTQATGSVVAGLGGGGVALTINDGYGNANVTFNHKAGTPEQNGNAARIEVNTDATSGASMLFELKSNVSSGSAVGLTSVLDLYETQVRPRVDVVPNTDSANNLGSTTKKWLNGYFDNLITDSIQVNNTGNASLKFNEATANGTNFVGFQAPANVASDVLWTLPATDAAVSGYALISDASGTLSWGQAGGGAKGGGGEQIFHESANTMNNDYTISANHNAVVPSPLTINATLTVNNPSVVTFV